jgi:hypothetical protein
MRIISLLCFLLGGYIVYEEAVKNVTVNGHFIDKFYQYNIWTPIKMPTF